MSTVTGDPALRDPARKVSRRAIGYWTTTAVIYEGIFLAILVVVYLVVLPERYWWASALLTVAVVLAVAEILVVPRFKFAVHRWEVTDSAIYTRSGWLNIEQRIAPLSRVQTVDSEQGAIQRMFRLASITVTTASSAGAIEIKCLDQDEARRVVAHLTEITGRDEGDAT
ncbi:PH domain-containing protein [Ornithinimicrobium ciconiae]|uniref:PH domain-containing protein n=1 Tax=Ornithinimicrobium ciconiae TaxID=2594265 RepID=A0A516GE35_9MICO|nr:PH domain-containing protein [Ornithinimicrobium ciconiae]QDO89793.1 PH domain-containing protein [Ornithinimicrobium ciconiae]